MIYTHLWCLLWRHHSYDDRHMMIVMCLLYRTLEKSLTTLSPDPWGGYHWGRKHHHPSETKKIIQKEKKSFHWSWHHSLKHYLHWWRFWPNATISILIATIMNNSLLKNKIAKLLVKSNIDNKPRLNCYCNPCYSPYIRPCYTPATAPSTIPLLLITYSFY
jgi:hypothetical protein